MGIFAGLGAVFTATVQIVVPLFSLENDLWRSRDDHTVGQLIFLTTVSAACICAAKSTTRVRFAIAAIAIVIGVDYTFGFTGVFTPKI